MHGGASPQAQRRAKERLAAADITPDRTIREIGSVAYTEVDAREVGITGKMKGLELLAKHFGLVNERVDHDVQIAVRWMRDDETQRVGEPAAIDADARLIEGGAPPASNDAPSDKRGPHD